MKATYTIEFMPGADGTQPDSVKIEKTRRLSESDAENLRNSATALSAGHKPAKVTEVLEAKRGDKVKRETKVVFIDPAYAEREKVLSGYRYAAYHVAHAHESFDRCYKGIAAGLRELADRVEREGAHASFINPSELSDAAATRDIADRDFGDFEYTSHCGKIANGLLHTLNYGVTNLNPEYLVGKAVDLDAAKLVYRQARARTLAAGVDPATMDPDNFVEMLADVQRIIDEAKLERDWADAISENNRRDYETRMLTGHRNP